MLLIKHSKILDTFLYGEVPLEIKALILDFAGLVRFGHRSICFVVYFK